MNPGRFMLLTRRGNRSDRGNRTNERNYQNDYHVDDRYTGGRLYPRSEIPYYPNYESPYAGERSYTITPHYGGSEWRNYDGERYRMENRLDDTVPSRSGVRYGRETGREETGRMHVGFERGRDGNVYSAIDTSKGSDATAPKYSDEMSRMLGASAMATSAPRMSSGGQMTDQVAREWVERMENEDGTTGPHWTREQTDRVREQHGITNIDPVEFWATMNMMYSDYVGAAKKLGVNNIDFYVCMTKAFLNDKDAGPDKLMAYYNNVVQH